MNPTKNDTFIVVVRWQRGSEEKKDVVSCDVTPNGSYVIVELVYDDGSSDRWIDCYGAKIRNP